MPRTRTEEDIARVQDDLATIDEEIRYLEMQAALEVTGRGAYANGMPSAGVHSSAAASTPTGYMMGGPQPGFGYPQGGGMYPYFSPLAGPYVFPQGNPGWSYAPPSPSVPPMMYPHYPFPPQYPLYPQPPMMHNPVADPNQAAIGVGRDRSGTQSVEQLRAMAAANKASNEETKPDLASAIKSSVIFTLGMIGEAAFFMVRDWLDTTKSRPQKVTIEEISMQDSIAMAAIEQLENTKSLTEKQKLKQVKSVHRLMQAKSTREVVAGLRNFGREEEAESLARRLVSIRKQMYGEEHVATVHAMNQLASVLVHKGEYEDAAETYQSALDGLRSYYKHRRGGAPALHEAHLLHNLASTLILQAQQTSEPETRDEIRAEALKLGRECAQICESKLGDRHAKTVQYKRVWVPGHAAKERKEPDGEKATDGDVEQEEATEGVT